MGYPPLQLIKPRLRSQCRWVNQGRARRVAQAFELAGTTSAVSAPSFARFVKGGSWNIHTMGRTHVVSTASRPALAKNARTGHPRLCYWSGNHKPKGGHLPTSRGETWCAPRHLWSELPDAVRWHRRCRGPSTPQNDPLRESFCFAQDDSVDLCYGINSVDSCYRTSGTHVPTMPSRSVLLSDRSGSAGARRYCRRDSDRCAP